MAGPITGGEATTAEGIMGVRATVRMGAALPIVPDPRIAGAEHEASPARTASTVVADSVAAVVAGPMAEVDFMVAEATAADTAKRRL